MLKKLIVVIFISCCAATVSFAQKKKVRRENAGDKLITSLIDAEEVRGIFADDAMYIFTAAPEMEAIFALGPKAVPLLIAHLDDQRLLNVTTYEASFDRAEAYTVTVGAACFDLLTYVIKTDPRFFDKGCLDDLMQGSEGHASACAKKPYAVFPQDFWEGQEQDDHGVWSGRTLVVKPQVRRAKRNWQTAYRKGQIRYEKFDG